MTQEELFRNPEVKEAVMAFFMAFMQQRKKETLKNYKLRNQYARKGQILFVGSSLMEGFPINEFQQTLGKQLIIYNRGIGGYTAPELLASMEECIFELEPSKIFINIGTNDISLPDYRKEKLIESYENILLQIKQRLPECKIYVMAYYPVNAKADFPDIDQVRKEEMFKTRTNPNIQDANEAIEGLARKHDCEFINVNEGLTDEEGNLKEEYAIEGLHIWPNGYATVLQNLKKYL